MGADYVRVSVKGRRFPPEVLTADEVRALLRACSSRAPTGVRNRAAIVLLYRAGLRISELLDLYPKDVDLEAGTITVLSGKGKRRRTIGLDPGATALIERWLEVRAGLGSARGWRPSSRRLICTLEGGPCHPVYFRQVLPRLARRAGIDKRVHPHCLRHTHAFELANEGMPPHLIQAQLGHTSLATTDRYLRHIAPMELVRAISAREWSL